MEAEVWEAPTGATAAGAGAAGALAGDADSTDTAELLMALIIGLGSRGALPGCSKFAITLLLFCLAMASAVSPLFVHAEVEAWFLRGSTNCISGQHRHRENGHTGNSRGKWVAIRILTQAAACICPAG